MGWVGITCDRHVCTEFSDCTCDVATGDCRDEDSPGGEPLDGGMVLEVVFLQLEFSVAQAEYLRAKQRWNGAIYAGLREVVPDADVLVSVSVGQAVEKLVQDAQGRAVSATAILVSAYTREKSRLRAALLAEANSRRLAQRLEEEVQVEVRSMAVDSEKVVFVG